MKKKITFLITAAVMLLTMMASTGTMWGQTRDTKTEGFETASAGSNYQGTVTITTTQSDCGIGWEIYYGCVSTSSKITGNNSAALRLYTTNNYGYIKTTTPIEGLSEVKFKAKAATTNDALIKVNISYSADGSNWTNLETDKTLTASAVEYSYDIPSGGQYFQIAISPNSTKPSSKNAQLTIDDVVFTYSSSAPTTYTVTYDCHGGESGCPDPLTISNITPGTSITLAAAPSRTNYSFIGWSDGTTTHDAGASYTVNGNVTMTAKWQFNIPNLFFESFDDCDGTGGNDNQWSGTIASGTLVSDNEAWTFANGSGAYKCAKFGTSTKLGSAQTPAISHTGDATLTFKAAAWNGNSESTTLKLSTTSGTLSASTVTLEKGAWTDYTINITGITTSTQIKFEGNAASNSRFFLDEVMVVEATPSTDPYITAEDVDIAYDATGGSIAYALNNASGNVSAVVTTGDWLTLGTITASEVPFTCSANNASAARTATVTLSYTGATDKIVTITQAGNPNFVNNISDITAAGTYTVKGTIVAMSTRGFVLGDGTGYVYYYYGNNFSTTHTVGDIVKLSGAVTASDTYKVFQFTSNATITDATESNYVAEDPTVISGADMDAQVASTATVSLSNYVQYQGTLTVSGNYYNITNIDGATTAQGSISFPTSTDFTSLDGKQVTVTGYYVGISSSQYYNTMIGSIEEVETEVEAPTFNPVAGTYAEAQNVTISCETPSTVIYYTLDGTEPDNTSTQYSGAISVSSATTIKAVAYAGGSDHSNVATAIYHICSADNPYTVAQALAAPTPGSDIYVQGTISKIDEVSTSYGNATYYISDDGTTTEQIKVYHGKYLDNAAFTAEDQIQVGDIVKIKGNLAVYNSVNQLGQGNYIVTLTHPAVPSITFNPAVINLSAEQHLAEEIPFTYANFEVGTYQDFSIQFYNATGQSVDKPDWISVAGVTGTNSEGYKVTLAVILENTGEARSTYFKVYAIVNSEEVYSNIVTISQEAGTTPLGDQYDLYTGTLVEGDYIIYYDGSAMKNTVDNGRLYYETVSPNDASIITDDATIVWHIAPSGEYWTIYSNDVQKYAASTGAKNKAQLLDNGNDDMSLWTVSGTETYEFVNKKNTANSVNANLRNNKNSTTNYGFACYGTDTGGALSLYKKVDGPVTPSITVNPASVTVTAAETDGSLGLTYENIEIAQADDFGIQFYDGNGDELTEDPDWIAVYVVAGASSDYEVSYLIEENTGAERTAYFKVYALDDDANDVYSNLVTITQEAAVTPGTTGTITFGSAEGSTNINSASVTGDDSLGNTWTITTEGTTSFTPNSAYAQVGSSSKPAESITFTTTLPSSTTITAFEAKFGGFSGTAGDIALIVDETTVGTGALNAGNDVVVENNTVATGTTLTVTVTDIAKGVKCYYISYTISEGSDPIIIAQNTINLSSTDTYGEFGYEVINSVPGTSLNATTTDSWISNINVTVDKVTFTTTPNTSTTDDREGTITLSYEGAANKTVSVIQSKVDYATLPFEFDGGKADIEGTTGLTQEGLGNDYSSTANLRFDDTGDYLILHLNAAPASLSYDIKGNTFSGGTYKVQTSADGINYSDLATYTELAAVVQSVTLIDLDANVRYIKWIYTEKSSGNVGMGNIHATEHYDTYGDVTFNNLDLTAPLQSLIIHDGSVVTVTGTLTNNSPDNLVIQDGGQLIHNNAVNATLQKNITGYGSNPDVADGWYLISSPVVEPELETSAVAIGTYDLFAYEEAAAYWWSNTGSHPFTTLAQGIGYLYANSANQTLNFAGTMVGTNTAVEKAMTAECTYDNLKGYNLMGNPFTCNLENGDIKIGATAITSVLVAEGGDDYVTVNLNEGAVKPGQGFMVQTEAQATLTLNPGGSKGANSGFIRIVAGNENSSDKAYINVANGNTLRKISLSDDNTKVYVMNDGKDYAAARVDELIGSMPVHFKAAEDGEYTITIEAVNTDTEYMHLIDNFTGDDIDLLLESSYTFNATTNDSEARFRLDFGTYGVNEIAENNTFAYQHGNEIVVSGEGDLQIFDVMGRMVKNTKVNGVERINVPANAVYIFKLDEKVQKIVVR